MIKDQSWVEGSVSLQMLQQIPSIFGRKPQVGASEQTQEFPMAPFVAKWYFGHLAQFYLSSPMSC